MRVFVQRWFSDRIKKKVIADDLVAFIRRSSESHRRALLVKLLYIQRNYQKCLKYCQHVLNIYENKCGNLGFKSECYVYFEK